jgi:hypothetical protein
MSYGTIKVDTITFTDNSVDKSVSLSGLIQNPTFTGNITVTGTISGDVIRGGTTVSGATVTGTTANFVSGVFTTQISGATVTGTTASFTSGVFTNISGTTATITSGIIASGTAAAPSLAILADLDTGLFSPGANQLAVATNGTARLYIASDGKVGAGTTAPTELLHLSGASATALVAASSGVGSIQLTRGTTAFQAYASTSACYIGTTSATDFQLRANNTERLRITSAGLVGIGTSGPSSQLDVRGSATDFDGLRVLNTNSGSGTQTSAAIRLGITNSFGAVNGIRNCRIQATENNTDSNDVHLDFYTNSAVGLDLETFKMRLTAGGALGIGTTSPLRDLHVSNGGAEGYEFGPGKHQTLTRLFTIIDQLLYTLKIVIELRPILGMYKPVKK